MTLTVIDASAAIGLLTPSQVTPSIRLFADTLADRTLLAPEIFPIELRHALVKLERRSLVGPHVANLDLPLLERLIEIEPGIGRADYARVLDIARAVNLGFYDALYVDLALRRRAEIATRDLAIHAASLRLGVAVLDLA